MPKAAKVAPLEGDDKGNYQEVWGKAESKSELTPQDKKTKKAYTKLNSKHSSKHKGKGAEKGEARGQDNNAEKEEKGKDEKHVEEPISIPEQLDRGLSFLELLNEVQGDFSLEMTKNTITGEGLELADDANDMLDEKERKRAEALKEKRLKKKQQELDRERYASHSPVAAKEMLALDALTGGAGGGGGGGDDNKRKIKKEKKKRRPQIILTTEDNKYVISDLKQSLQLPPDEKRVAKHLEMHQPRDKTDTGLLEPFPLYEFPDFRFGEYGLGVKAYIALLKRMMWSLLIMLVYCIPLLVLYANGDYFGPTSPSSSMTMGNLGPAYINGTYQEDVSFLSMTLSRRTVSIVAVMTNVVFIAIVGYTIYRMANLQLREDRQYQERQEGIHRYTVWVQNPPPDMPDKFLWKRFFRERGGPVYNVELFYNMGNTLELLIKRGDLNIAAREAAFRRDRETLSKLAAEMKKVERDIEAIRETKASKPELLCAFVTFEDEFAKNKCLNLYYKGAHKIKYPKALLMKENRLEVTQAPEPKRILFENLHYTDRKFRRTVSVLIQVAILLVSFGIIVMLRSISDNYKEELENCPEEDVTEAQAAADSKLMPCYCKTLGASLVTDSTCADYQFMQTVVYLSSLVVIVFNYVLVWVARFLADYEKHKLRYEREVMKTRTLFILMFLNTSVLITAIEARLSIVHSIMPFSPILAGDFDEPGAVWFVAVAQSFVIYSLLDFIHPIVLFLYKPCLDCKRKCKCVKIESQYALNKSMYGPKFEIAERMAIILNRFFFAFVYMSGTPIIPILALGNFFLTYWADRYAFLRYYETPHQYDYSLGLLAIEILPWALVLHTLMSLWLFSGPIWSPTPLPESLNMIHSALQALNLGHFANWQSFFFLVFALLIVAYVVYEQVRGSCKQHRDHPIELFQSEDPDIINEAKERTVDSAIEKCGSLFGTYNVSNIDNYMLAFLSFEEKKTRKEEKGEKKKKRVKKFDEDEEEEDGGDGDDNKEGNEKKKKKKKKEDPNKPSKKFLEAQKNLKYGEVVIEMAPKGYLQYVMVPCPKCSREFTIADEGYQKEYQCPFCGKASLF